MHESPDQHCISGLVHQREKMFPKGGGCFGLYTQQSKLTIVFGGTEKGNWGQWPTDAGTLHDIKMNKSLQPPFVPLASNS
jgi:hypothetical protein